MSTRHPACLPDLTLAPASDSRTPQLRGTSRPSEVRASCLTSYCLNEIGGPWGDRTERRHGHVRTLAASWIPRDGVGGDGQAFLRILGKSRKRRIRTPLKILGKGRRGARLGQAHAGEKPGRRPRRGVQGRPGRSACRIWPRSRPPARLRPEGARGAVARRAVFSSTRRGRSGLAGTARRAGPHRKTRPRRKNRPGLGRSPPVFFLRGR